jgi:hypothetical protein
MKSGLDAMPLFLLDDLLNNTEFEILFQDETAPGVAIPESFCRTFIFSGRKADISGTQPVNAEFEKKNPG